MAVGAAAICADFSGGVRDDIVSAAQSTGVTSVTYLIQVGTRGANGTAQRRSIAIDERDRESPGKLTHPRQRVVDGARDRLPDELIHSEP
jgi:hypothetical protein